jgi:hypothetical protein
MCQIKRDKSPILTTTITHAPAELAVPARADDLPEHQAQTVYVRLLGVALAEEDLGVSNKNIESKMC